jgi:hypothetical protein
MGEERLLPLLNIGSDVNFPREAGAVLGVEVPVCVCDLFFK